MKLITFKREKKISRAGSPAITFQKNGTIRFTVAACELIWIKKNTAVFIHQDADMKRCFFIEKTTDENAFLCHPMQKTYGFTARELAKKIQRMCGIDDTVSLKISTTPKKLLGKTLWQFDIDPLGAIEKL